MSEFTIRTDFQIWTINRITVELKKFFSIIRLLFLYYKTP